MRERRREVDVGLQGLAVVAHSQTFYGVEVSTRGWRGSVRIGAPSALHARAPLLARAVKLITDFLLELEEIPDIFQKSVYVAEIDLRMANAC